MNADNVLMWLTMPESMGPKKTAAILAHFSDFNEICEAPRESFAEIAQLNEQDINALFQFKNRALTGAFAENLKKRGVSYVSLNSPDYPAPLRDLADKPVILYYLGRLPDFGTAVSVVGSRRASEYGVITAKKICFDLARHGVLIVSGMARGIDTFAHLGALEAGGETVAVLGCGVDICYPSENRPLYERIIKAGCVISEYAPGTRPLPHYFPIRNRVISGLSRAVAVVEASERSGTLITVDAALEQGREVLAVPGNITSRLSYGTNNLIKQGAGVIISGCDDVLCAIGLQKRAEKQAPAPAAPLTADEQKTLNVLSKTPQDAEYIAAKAGLNVTAVVSVCVMLEIYGLAEKLPGLRYVKK